jgi:phage terminase large subunit GpA-like protein
LREQDRSTILEWAEKHVQLPHSDRAKRFDRRQAPWLNGVLEAATDEDTREVVLCAPVGSGKTTMFEVLACWIVAREPGGTMFVLQSDTDATDWAETRLRRVLEECGPIAPLWPKNRHQKRKAAVLFPHMSLFVNGANINNLQSKSLRWCVGDEVWLWKAGLVEEFRRRTHDRWNSKRVFVGQAGESEDEFAQALAGTSLYEFQFACPKCGLRQPWRWEQMKYTIVRDRGGAVDWDALAASVVMECGGCGERFADEARTRRMLSESGEYVQISKGMQFRKGFTYPAMAVWWIPWATLVEEWVRACAEEKRGDMQLLKKFKQKRLAQAWEDQGGGAKDEQVLAVRGDYRQGFCPVAEPWFVTLCADPGQAQTHWSVAAHTQEGEISVFDYGECLAPEDLLELVGKAWPTEKGQVFAQAGLVDSGDFTERIYDVCARSEGILFPAKGSGGTFGTWTQTELKERGGLMLYTYVDRAAKVSLYIDRIALLKPPRLSFPADATEDFLRGHMGQRLVPSKTGKIKEWRKVAGDHYGDCTKLHLVAHWILSRNLS